MSRGFHIDEINKTVNLSFDFDDDIIKSIKLCDYNTRWNPELNEWIIPVNSYSKPRIQNIIKVYNFKLVKKKVIDDIKISYEKSDIDYAYLKGLCDSKGFTYDPRKYQLEALGYGLDKGNIINGDDVGLGKAEYIKNRVFTPYGRKEIGKLKIGDYVIGSNGKKTKVLGVFPQPLKPIYKMTFNDGFSIKVCEAHLFNVTSCNGSINNSNRGVRYHTLSIKQMLNKEYSFTQYSVGKNKGRKYITKSYYKGKNGRNKWQIPIVAPIEFNDNVLPINPYLLGIILGDGHIRSNGSISIALSKNDFDEVFENQLLNEIKPVLNARINSINTIKDEIKSLCLNGKLSYDKFIPDIYKYSSIENRLELLRGLMDSDGHCGGHNANFYSTEYSTVSKQLCDDVCEIVHSLGGIVRKSIKKSPKYTYKGEIKTGRPAYRLNIKMPAGINPFKLKRKAGLYNPPTKYKVGRYIKDISFERVDECVCISVEAEDSLYVTEHGIVTHNTFESIMYAEVTNSFPCLVVVPASVKYNWQEKWLEITGKKREVSVIESKETNKRKNNWSSEVVVINYDIIGKKQGKGATVRFKELVETIWKMVIFDEAHFLKNKGAQRSIASKMITKGDKIIQLLTGTAVMSKPVELWNLLVLSKQDQYIAKDWHQFVTRYCGGYRGKFGWVTDGATNTLELNRRLRETCYIRREKRDVLNELPEVTKQIIQVPISNIRAIKRATDDFIEYIRETKGDESAESAMEAEHLVALGTLRKLAIEGKLKGIEQYLKDWKEAGNGKLVVFGLHREPLDYLSSKYKSLLIAGGTSAINKQKIVKEWCNNDDPFLFANMQSAGTGVDGLQHVCSNMLIIELPWRPSDLAQVIGRLDRSGQKVASTITFMLNDSTIDSEMWSMLEDKERVTEAVNKGIDVKRNGSGMRAVIRKILKNK